MKKSQLRKIIRESFKGLMTEQTSPAKTCKMYKCTGLGSGASSLIKTMTVNGNQPQVGDVIDMGSPGGGIRYIINCWNPTSLVMLSNYNIYNGPHCCRQACGTYAGGGAYAGGGPAPGSPQGMNGGCSSNTGAHCCNGALGSASWVGSAGTNGWYGVNGVTANWPGPTKHVCDQPGYPQTFTGTTPCDNTPTSTCATQWFGNTAGNFTAWMASKDCSNYQSVVNQLEPQAIALMAAAPNPQPGPYNDWNAIKNAANVSNLGQPQKGQFKRKMAKAMYSQCQITDCSC